MVVTTREKHSAMIFRPNKKHSAAVWPRLAGGGAALCFFENPGLAPQRYVFIEKPWLGGAALCFLFGKPGPGQTALCFLFGKGLEPGPAALCFFGRGMTQNDRNLLVLPRNWLHFQPAQPPRPAGAATCFLGLPGRLPGRAQRYVFFLRSRAWPSSAMFFY